MQAEYRSIKRGEAAWRRKRFVEITAFAEMKYPGEESC